MTDTRTLDEKLKPFNRLMREIRNAEKANSLAARASGGVSSTGSCWRSIRGTRSTAIVMRRRSARAASCSPIPRKPTSNG